MTRRLLFIFIFSLSFLFNACGSGASSDKAVQTFSQGEKEFLHTLFLTEYLWYDQVAQTVDYTLFSQSQEMIDALRINPINSPAYNKLYRGDQILEINGEAVTELLITQASQNLNTPATFTLLRDGTPIDVSVTPSEYSFNVSLGKTLIHEDKKVGYLRYDAFTESSVAEFEQIFSTFYTQHINELVIDLRYNGGGSIVTASVLLDNISNAYAGQRQMYLDWNENYKHNNASYTFEDADLQDGNELTMKRVFFLTTKDSASASEAVINALKPYLGDANVITIGDNTHGKPVGMSGRTYGLNYYFLINFFVRNNAEQSTSFDGIPATCYAQDDITHPLGDPQEVMLKTALVYMTTGVCL
jgi:hypothetical protein